MSQALTRYEALFESIRSRRRREPVLKGLDALAGRAGARARALAMTLRRMLAEARRIDALAPDLHAFSDAALDDTAAQCRERFVRGRPDATAVRFALAVTREIARRETGEEAYVVQLAGALALYHGRIIEMLTGEGKTLTGSLVAPLLAWRHRHVHVFTVNDYLARRDAASRRSLYARCGVGVGAIQQEEHPRQREAIYARGIVYGTPKQITADWLRDQIRLERAPTVWTARQQLAMLGALDDGPGSGGGAWAVCGPIVPGLRAAMVDEADAVLIDEGVVPLIIARARREDDMAEVYRYAAHVASRLDEGPDFAIDRARRSAELRRRGQHRCRLFFAERPDPIWKATRRAEELVRQALVARHCYRHGHQYQIVDGRVVIVDEYTGRFLPDRSWEHGLHQAIEAKENLAVTADRETLARVSFQRFFRGYPFLCGMTGTAADATGEMEHIYRRAVVAIPTNRPMIRRTWPMRVFRSSPDKWSAIADSIERVHTSGRPVLVGTRSIEASEFLSARLADRALPHQVLNALHDAEEAEMIARAGRGGRDAAITVATNMAGRGTDIRLDDDAARAGGLHVVLTDLHSAKRIDRQFMGRAGRQGDPGSAQAFVSFEDELITHHLPRLGRMLRRRMSDRTLRALGRVLFRTAQMHAERRARLSRAAVLRQDDWLDRSLPG